MSLMEKTIRDLAPLIETKELSPVELVDECLQQIAKTEAQLNAYITVVEEQARAAAAVAEREVMQGRYRGVLHGIPYSAKDLFFTKGIRTTAGSAVLADNIPEENATVIERLTEAGAILVGKNNLHEFAYGTTSENEHFGPCRNPWDTRMITGGSSGGSAASVAAGSSLFSLGTDTGGSIRIPAAFCGITGLKPTYGRVSKRGVIPLSWSQDHIGPLARSVWDTAAVLTAIAGPDPGDPNSARQTVPDYVNLLSRPGGFNLNNLTVGICPRYYAGLLQPEVEQAFLQVVAWFAAGGAKIRELSYPRPEIFGIGHILTMTEAFTYHEENLKTSAGKYGPSVRRRLEKGQYIPASAYINAQRMRRQDQETWKALYKEIDIFLSPTTVTPPFPVGQATVPFGAQAVDPRVHGVLTYLTILGDFNGCPVISLPCGFTAAGLPLGVQIQGRPFDETLVLQAAYAFEQAHGPGAALAPVSA
jgi:aspartyl-tRNA(Asn)/glutamyl-tRNA(Gln) amidotransferase subunit A